MVKVLNLYSGIGGNRKLWKDVEVTAVEFNSKIANIYKDFFPKDNVIIGDAHEYLRKNFKKFDFIWTSPPCQSHSSFRQNICVRYRGTEPKFPDMSLWQEIIFLKYNFDGKFVVENVNPYYPVFNSEIKPKLLQRHYFWSNFEIPDKEFSKVKIRTAQIPDLQEYHGFNISKYKISDKRQILRNCVDSELGLHIFQAAFKEVDTNAQSKA